MAENTTAGGMSMGDERAEDLKTPRTKITVVTEQCEFLGFLHTLSADRRETDILNDEKSFIHLTDVEIRIKGEMPKNVPFVAVNKANILCVIPEE
jgi:hypothetical protein